MPAALIVAHGSPADPDPQEAALRNLAHAVAAHLPGWDLRGATLAKPGALDRAAEGLAQDALVYPFFMAPGWFTGQELPRRLGLAGAAGLRRLAPFGTDPALPDLVAQVTEAGAHDAGLVPGETTLLLAAHGGKRSAASAEGTQAMAEAMRGRGIFARVLTGFVEEAPWLADAARGTSPAVCLPFFALRAGHVAGDVPDALEKAGFSGPVLPPIGDHPQAAALIAAALRRAAAE